MQSVNEAWESIAQTGLMGVEKIDVEQSCSTDTLNCSGVPGGGAEGLHRGLSHHRLHERPQVVCRHRHRPGTETTQGVCG